MERHSKCRWHHNRSVCVIMHVYMCSVYVRTCIHRRVSMHAHAHPIRRVSLSSPAHPLHTPAQCDVPYRQGRCTTPHTPHRRRRRSRVRAARNARQMICRTTRGDHMVSLNSHISHVSPAAQLIAQSPRTRASGSQILPDTSSRLPAAPCHARL